MLKYLVVGVILTMNPMLLMLINPDYAAWWVKPSMALGLLVIGVVTGIHAGRWLQARRASNNSH